MQKDNAISFASWMDFSMKFIGGTQFVSFKLILIFIVWNTSPTHLFESRRNRIMSLSETINCDSNGWIFDLHSKLKHIFFIHTEAQGVGSNDNLQNISSTMNDDSPCPIDSIIIFTLPQSERLLVKRATNLCGNYDTISIKSDCNN